MKTETRNMEIQFLREEVPQKGRNKRDKMVFKAILLMEDDGTSIAQSEALLRRLWKRDFA